MKRNNYITIMAFMILDLDLKGNELIAYALIYGFSQDGETSFNGSLNYISQWLGISKQSTINILKKLMEKNLIKKEQIKDKNKTIRNIYFIKNTNNQNEIKEQSKNLTTPSQKTLQPQSKNLTTPSQKTLPNNNKSKKEIKKEKETATATEKEEQLNKILKKYPPSKNLGIVRTLPEFKKKNFTNEEINLICEFLSLLPETYKDRNYKFMPNSINFFKNNYAELFIEEQKKKEEKNKFIEYQMTDKDWDNLLIF